MFGDKVPIYLIIEQDSQTEKRPKCSRKERKPCDVTFKRRTRAVPETNSSILSLHNYQRGFDNVEREERVSNSSVGIEDVQIGARCGVEHL